MNVIPVIMVLTIFHDITAIRIIDSMFTSMAVLYCKYYYDDDTIQRHEHYYYYSY